MCLLLFLVCVVAATCGLVFVNSVVLFNSFKI